MQIIGRICDAYQLLSKYVDEIPPIQQPMRYGNKAFRTWLGKVREVCIIQMDFLFVSYENVF